ncbi:MAG: TRAP transporter small permease subunit, partial [Deltaproteobacteria bacterium]|nr:TRAP transporter small permease subunit [Deltaproteobacteria bacterium]
FVKMLPNKLHRLVSLGSIGCCLIYCGLFIKGSWVYLEKIHSIAIEMEDLPIPKWIAHSILLLGMIMLAWRLLQLLWEVYTGKTEGFKLADEAKESMHLAQKMPDQTAVGGGDTA